MKHPDCEERCQMAEYKGYQPCQGFCFYDPEEKQDLLTLVQRLLSNDSAAIEGTKEKA